MASAIGGSPATGLPRSPHQSGSEAGWWLTARFGARRVLVKPHNLNKRLRPVNQPKSISWDFSQCRLSVVAAKAYNAEKHAPQHPATQRTCAVLPQLFWGAAVWLAGVSRNPPIIHVKAR